MIRFTNNTVDGEVKQEFVRANISGQDLIVRNNKFAKIARHAFLGLAPANKSAGHVTLRFVGNLVNECSGEGLKFNPGFVPGTKTLNLSEIRFNTSCTPELKGLVLNWAPEVGELMWVTGSCLSKAGNFVPVLAAGLGSSVPAGAEKREETNLNITQLLAIAAAASVGGVLFVVALVFCLCCTERRKRCFARNNGARKDNGGHHGRNTARRTRSGVVLTDSWNFGTTHSTTSSGTGVTSVSGTLRLVVTNTEI